MARIHLAWELGAGLGHVGRLKPLALELARRGNEVSLSVRDLVGTHSVLRDLKLRCLQAPVWLHNTVGLPKKPASLAEILLATGYLDAGALGGLVLGWRGLLQSLRSEVVVADYAPTAILAARTVGAVSASLGLGFTSPPAGIPLPNIRSHESIEPGRLEASEARLLQSVNRVLASHAAAPIEHGWQLFAGDRTLLCNWPELDCYARGTLPAGERWYGACFDAGAGVAPAWPEGAGPRVFAYLKSGHRDHAVVLRALADTGCRTLCYLPDVASGKPPPVVHDAIRYASGPVDLEAAFAACDLCVCHAGGATIAQSLLAGVPLLLLPMQNEQLLNAASVERLGAGISAAGRAVPLDYAAAIKALTGAPAARDAARAFADRHRDFTQTRQTSELCDAIEALAARG